MWHEALEEASRMYFGEHNIDGMLAVLEPLHAMLERGAETIKENTFIQVVPSPNFPPVPITVYRNTNIFLLLMFGLLFMKMHFVLISWSVLYSKSFGAFTPFNYQLDIEHQIQFVLLSV